MSNLRTDTSSPQMEGPAEYLVSDFHSMAFAVLMST
jgi:hypothetical protein